MFSLNRSHATLPGTPVAQMSSTGPRTPGQMQAWRVAEQMVGTLVRNMLIHSCNVTAFVRLFLGQAPPSLPCTRSDYAASPPAALSADTARTPREAFRVMQAHLHEVCGYQPEALSEQARSRGLVLSMHLFVAEHGASAFDDRAIFCAKRFLVYLETHGVRFSTGEHALLMQVAASQSWIFDATRSTSDAVSLGWRAAGMRIPLMPEWRQEKKFMPYRSIRAHASSQSAVLPAIAALPSTQLAMWWAERLLTVAKAPTGLVQPQDPADRGYILEAAFRAMVQRGRRTLLPHAEWGNYLCETFADMERRDVSRTVHFVLTAHHPLVLGLRIKMSEAGAKCFVATLDDPRNPRNHLRTVSRDAAAKYTVLTADDFLSARERMAYYTSPVSLVLDDRTRTPADIAITPGCLTLEVLHHLFDTGSVDVLHGSCTEQLRALPEPARQALLMAWFDKRCSRPAWNSHSVDDALRQNDRMRIEAVQQLLEAAQLTPAMQLQLFQKRPDDSTGLFWRSLGHGCARHNIGRLLAPGATTSLAPEQVLDLLTECDRHGNRWLCSMLARDDAADVMTAVARIADQCDLLPSYRMLLARMLLQQACRDSEHEERNGSALALLRWNSIVFLQRIGLSHAQQASLLIERQSGSYPLLHAAWMPDSRPRYGWLSDAIRQLPPTVLTDVLCAHDTAGRSLLATLLHERLPAGPFCRWIGMLSLSMPQREAIYRASDRDGLPCIVSLLRAGRGVNAYARLLKASGLSASQQYCLWRGSDEWERAACRDALRASDDYAGRYRRRLAEFREARDAVHVSAVPMLTATPVQRHAPRPEIPAEQLPRQVEISAIGRAKGQAWEDGGREVQAEGWAEARPEVGTEAKGQPKARMRDTAPRGATPHAQHGTPRSSPLAAMPETT